MRKYLLGMVVNCYSHRKSEFFLKNRRGFTVYHVDTIKVNL